jgi:hypothetical protein
MLFPKERIGFRFDDPVAITSDGLETHSILDQETATAVTYQVLFLQCTGGLVCGLAPTESSTLKLN